MHTYIHENIFVCISTCATHTHSVCVSMSLCLISVSISLSTCICLCLCVCLSISVSVCVSVCLYLSPNLLRESQPSFVVGNRSGRVAQFLIQPSQKTTRTSNAIQVFDRLGKTKKHQESVSAFTQQLSCLKAKDSKMN